MPINTPSPWLGGIGDALYTLGQSITQQQAQKQALALQQQAAAQRAQEFQQQQQLEWAKLQQQGQIAGLTKLLAEQQRQQTFDENAAGKAPVTYGSPTDPNYTATPLDANTKAIVQDSSYAPQLKDVQAPLPLMSAFGAPALGDTTILGTILTPNQSQQQAYDTKQASEESAKTLKDQRDQANALKKAQDDAVKRASDAYNAYVAGEHGKQNVEGEMAAVQAALQGTILPTGWMEGALPKLWSDQKLREAVEQHRQEQAPAFGAGINWTLGGEDQATTDFKKSLSPDQQKFINQFSQQDQQTIARLASYDYIFPSGMGGMTAALDPKKPFYQLWNAAQHVNPTLSPYDYEQRQTFMKGWSSPNSQVGQQVQSASRVMEHMAVQMQNIAALHNEGSRPLNAARNLTQTYLEGGAAPGNFSETNQYLSQEIAKLWSGASTDAQGRQAFAVLNSPNASATQQYNALYTLYKLMRGQIDSLEGGYVRNMGRPLPSSILTPSAQDAQQALLLNLPAFMRDPTLAYGSK